VIPGKTASAGQQPVRRTKSFDDELPAALARLVEPDIDSILLRIDNVEIRTGVECALSFFGCGPHVVTAGLRVSRDGEDGNELSRRVGTDPAQAGFAAEHAYRCYDLIIESQRNRTRAPACSHDENASAGDSSVRAQLNARSLV
jgi:hypothetical protein